MSQEKTEVGLGLKGNSANGMKETSRRYNGEGTVTTGMGEFAPGIGYNNVTNNATQEPVVGFLYSISRQGIGEFWPLHIGRNTIGRSTDCDVCLRERTVSDLHAVLNIKQMKTTHKVLASIKDEGSKNGIFVNDIELGYDSHACSNNDILTVGLNYKLLLLLIDTESYGLSVSEEFIDAAEPEANEIDFNPKYDTQRTGFNPYDHSHRSSSNETQAMDGSYRTAAGKTEIM